MNGHWTLQGEGQFEGVDIHREIGGSRRGGRRGRVEGRMCEIRTEY